jgi:hypothetical protein
VKGVCSRSRSPFLCGVSDAIKSDTTGSDLEVEGAVTDSLDGIETCDKGGTSGKGGVGDGGDVDICFPSGMRWINPALKDILNGRNLLVDWAVVVMEATAFGLSSSNSSVSLLFSGSGCDIVDSVVRSLDEWDQICVSNDDSGLNLEWDTMGGRETG